MTVKRAFGKLFARGDLVGAPPSGPWLALCRQAVDDVKVVLKELPGRAEREPVLRAGAGGDDTTAIDAAAEAAIVARLEALHVAESLDFRLISEELGERDFGSEPRRHVLVDPIDGSMNAKRNIPYFSLSIAVADGSRMQDMVFGYVYDFGTGEEWTAAAGGGAWLDGVKLGSVRPKDEIELLAVEATVSRAVAEKAEAFAGYAKRIRIMGSLALSLCHFSAGRFDAVCSLKAARPVDIAAAQLLLREVGLPIAFADGGPFGEAVLDSAPRSAVAAAGSAELCEQLARIVAS